MALIRAVAAAALLVASAGAALADNPESLLARSHAAERAGNRDAAVRLAQSAIVADPQRASSYVGLADVYMHAGQVDFAGFYYAEALQIDPQNKEAVQGLETTDRTNKTQAAATEGSLDKENSGH